MLLIPAEPPGTINKLAYGPNNSGYLNLKSILFGIAKWLISPEVPNQYKSLPSDKIIEWVYPAAT